MRGSPKHLTGAFICMQNDLISFEGGPTEVGGVVNFQYNYNKIKSLKGLPEKVSGDFYCDDDILHLIQSSYQDVSGISKIIGKTGQIDDSGRIVRRKLY